MSLPRPALGNSMPPRTCVMRGSDSPFGNGKHVDSIELRAPLLCFFGCERRSTPESRNRNRQTFAQVERSFVNRHVLSLCPQIELITSCAATEAPEGVLLQIRREGAAGRRTGSVNRARPTKLVTALPGRSESEQIQHLSER